MAGNRAREDETSSAVLIQKVEQRVRLNRILSVAFLMLSVAVIAAMTTGMIVMFSRISTLELEAAAVAAANQELSLNKQFNTLERQLMLLADFRQSELKKITAYTEQMDNIRNDCRLVTAAPYQAFLASREQDFNQLIRSVKEGATSLAGMNQGSKDWLDDYTKALDDLVLRSSERQAELDALLDGVSDD